MIDAMYEIPSTKKKSLDVTKEYVAEKLSATNLDVLADRVTGYMNPANRQPLLSILYQYRSNNSLHLKIF